MPLQLLCPGCQKQLRIDESDSGQIVRCPRCGVSFTANGAAGEPGASATGAKPAAGIADRPIPPRAAAGEQRFDPSEDAGPPRTSSKLPLILILVIVCVVLLPVLLVVVVIALGVFWFWVGASPKQAASGPVAMQADAPAQEMADQMRGPQEGQWNDDLRPGMIQEITGPDEKGRLSFYTSRQVDSVAFIDNGKALMAATDNDGEVRRWELNPPRATLTITPSRRDQESRVALAPDGKSFVILGHGGSAQIIDVATNRKTDLSEPERTGFPLWAAYSPTGKILATTGGDNVIKLFEVETVKLLATLHKHTAPVRSLAFSSDGKLLASGGCDATVIVWNVSEGRDVAKIMAPGTKKKRIGNVEVSELICAVAFSPDEDLLAFGGTDNVLHLWDFRARKERATCRHLKEVTSIAFSADGKLLASSSDVDGIVRLWDGVTGERRALLQTDTNGSTRALAFSPDGKKLAVGVNGVQLWDLTKVEMLK